MHYFRIAYHLFIMSLKRSSMYRMDFLFRLLRSFSDILIALLVIQTVYSSSPSILGWTLNQAFIVYAIFQLIWAANFTFVGEGIKTLHSNIIEGTLDQLLLKPLDGQFSVSFQASYVTSLMRFFFSLILLIYALSLQPHLTPTSLLIGFLALFSGMLIHYSLSFISATTAFWTFVGEFQTITESLSTIATFPIPFYGRRLNILFTLIPLAFIATIPAQAFSGTSYVLALVSPIIAIVLFLLSRIIWFIGLKSYSSVSS